MTKQQEIDKFEDLFAAYERSFDIVVTAAQAPAYLSARQALIDAFAEKLCDHNDDVPAVALTAFKHREIYMCECGALQDINNSKMRHMDASGFYLYDAMSAQQIDEAIEEEIAARLKEVGNKLVEALHHTSLLGVD